MYFNDKEMISVDASNLANEVLRHKDVNVLLIDLNKCDNIDVCNEVLYLIEPSTIKLNKLMRRDRNIFSKLAGRKIVLAQSILSDSDIKEFEYEANIKIFFVMPPLDERENNSEVLQNLLNRIGIINY